MNEENGNHNEKQFVEGEKEMKMVVLMKLKIRFNNKTYAFDVGVREDPLLSLIHI